MTTINIYEAKTQLSKLIEKAAAGTDVIIARGGKPVARLMLADDCLNTATCEHRKISNQ